MRSFSLVKFIALVLNCSFLLLACSQAPNTVSEENQTSDEGSFQLLDPLLPSDSGALVKLEASVNNALYQPAGDNAYRYLYVEVSTKEYEASEQTRKPLNISLVIDQSGSMEGEKMDFVKQAASFVVQNLTKTDYISIVSYGNNVDVTWPAAELQDKKTLNSKIESLFSKGGTNLSGGLLQGYEEVKTFFNPNYTNRVLLLTDGLANEGITDPGSLSEIAKTKNLTHNTTLSTFGVGSEFNEDLLQQMAELGSGNYYYIKSPEEIPAIFQEELDGLLSVVAQNAELLIDLPQGVSLVQVFGYQHQQEGQQVRVAFKDLVAEEEKGVLLKLKIEGAIDTDLEFATHLSYTDAVSDFDQHKLLVNTVMEPSTDTATIRQSGNVAVEQWVTFYVAHYQLAQAVKEAENDRLDNASFLLLENKKYIEARNKTYGETDGLGKMINANSTCDSLINSGTAQGYKNGSKGFKKEIYDLKTRKK